MSGSGDSSPLVEQHPEVVDDISQMWEDVFGGDPDMDDLSDDVGTQLLRDSSERCGRAGIPRDERVDVIMAGVRKFQERQMEEGLQDLRYQLELMFSI